jgi:hypothetical protein
MGQLAALFPQRLGAVSVCVVLLLSQFGVVRAEPASAAEPGPLIATEFLPADAVTDGSVSYQQRLQKAIDTAAAHDRPLVFPAMTYRLEDPKGLRLRSGSELRMHGAVFQLAKDCAADGQAFRGEGVSNVRLEGGTVLGRRDDWPDRVYIGGVRIVGQSRNIRIENMTFRDLTSHGIGILGSGENAPTRNVTLTSITARNCCPQYRDYLQPDPGVARGSERSDQGDIVLYHVQNFSVTGCDLAGSGSNGTRFFQCNDGRFINNRVAHSHMGGYFLERCDRVLAADNSIVGNGSRGVTIERGSHHCTVINNVVRDSGREGLWAPDVVGLLVQGNIFKHNGQKDHDPLDAEVMVEERKKWTTQAKDLRIAGNQIITQDHQNYAVRITAGVERVVFADNVLRGAVQAVRAGPWEDGKGSVVIEGNTGWPTSASGMATFQPNGQQRVFKIPHGLVHDPAWSHAEVTAQLTPRAATAARSHHVQVSGEHLQIKFHQPPAQNSGPIRMNWQARLRQAEASADAQP